MEINDYYLPNYYQTFILIFTYRVWNDNGRLYHVTETADRGVDIFRINDFLFFIEHHEFLLAFGTRTD